jgi:hypothetical protein
MLLFTEHMVIEDPQRFADTLVGRIQIMEQVATLKSQIDLQIFSYLEYLI